jgi:hypothetical protein
MVAIQAMSQANGLQLLKSQRHTVSAAEGFVSSAAFSVSGGGALDAILSVFAADSDLAAQFTDIFAAKMEDEDLSGMHPDNARHIALYETIVANREKFPPGEFYIHTELPGGGSITTFISAIGAPADSAPAWSDRPQPTITTQARAAIAAAMLEAGAPRP